MPRGKVLSSTELGGSGLSPPPRLWGLEGRQGLPERALGKWPGTAG